MPARICFVHMKGFYASVEQHELADLRGRPTIVVPMLTDSTCAIVASYEAKAHGIKTGTSVRLARIACPNLHIIEARPELYLSYHQRIVNVLRDPFATI